MSMYFVQFMLLPKTPKPLINIFKGMKEIHLFDSPTAAIIHAKAASSVYSSIADTGITTLSLFLLYAEVSI
jgi:hypothetical protein